MASISNLYAMIQLLGLISLTRCCRLHLHQAHCLQLPPKVKNKCVITHLVQRIFYLEKSKVSFSTKSWEIPLSVGKWKGQQKKRLKACQARGGGQLYRVESLLFSQLALYRCNKVHRNTSNVCNLFKSQRHFRK